MPWKFEKRAPDHLGYKKLKIKLITKNCRINDTCSGYRVGQKFCKM